MRRLYAAAAVLAVTGLVVVWLVEPNLLVGLRSPRALAWTAAVAAGCVALVLLARRLGVPPVWALLLGALPGVVAGGLVVARPILSPRTLSEALPAAAGAPAPATASPAAAAGASGPERVATARLRGLAGHSARGTVSTYRLADGGHVVRFEGVDIGGTPDPEVYVLEGRDRTGKRGGVHLGALKAEKGTFHYTLPASFGATGFTVVVWCERFAVDIAHATPA